LPEGGRICLMRQGKEVQRKGGSKFRFGGMRGEAFGRKRVVGREKGGGGLGGRLGAEYLVCYPAIRRRTSLGGGRGKTIAAILKGIIESMTVPSEGRSSEPREGSKKSTFKSAEKEGGAEELTLAK